MIRDLFLEMLFSSRDEFGKEGTRRKFYTLLLAGNYSQRYGREAHVVRTHTFCWSVVSYPTSQLQSLWREEFSSLLLAHPHH